MQTATQQDVKVKEKKSPLLYMYPALDFGGGIWKAYFSTYIPMLYTDIYLMSVVLSGALELVTQFTSWFVGPAWGTLLDRVTLKTGKYWQWIVTGAIATTVIYIAIFSVPALSSNASALTPLIFVLALILAFSLSITDTTVISLYPRLAESPKDRTFMTIGKSIGRTGSKTIFGFLVPIMLIFFTGVGGSDAAGWSVTAIVLSLAGLLFYLCFSFMLKRSKVERQAIEERNTPKASRKKMSMLAVLKGVVSNRPLLVMFAFFVIHKIYDLGFQTTTASYFFRYYQNNFAALSTFMTVRTMAQAVGAVAGIVWLRLFRDSKRAFVSAGIIHIAILGVSTLVIRGLGTMGFTLLLSASSFFVGLMEAYTLPFFAAACDYGQWKTGARADGLNMSAYTVALRVAIALSATVRVAILAWAGYNAQAYTDGAAPGEQVLTQLSNLQALYPFILAIVCVSLVAFFYPINDKKLVEIKDELERRKRENEGAAQIG